MIQKGGGVDHAVASSRLSTFQDAVDHRCVIHALQGLAVADHLAV